MEWVIIAIIAIGICIYYGNKKSKSEESAPSTGATNQYQPAQTPFSIMAGIETRTVDGTPFQVFYIKGRGDVRVPYENYPVVFKTLLLDVTSGTNEPVLSTIEQFQMKDSMIFSHQSGQVNIPYSHTTFTSPIELLVVPTDVLVFPKKGARRLEFIVQISGRQNVGEATTYINYYNPNLGYAEIVEKREKAQEETVRLCALMCAVDGQPDSKETEIIREWIYKRTEKDGSIDSAKRQRFMSLIYSTITGARQTGMSGMTEACAKINELSDPAYKYEVVELLIKIASVDGKYNRFEQDFITQVSKYLGVNMDRVRTMVNKAVDISHYDSSTDIDRQLGLTESMTVEEKKRRLREEYRRWNQQAASNNEKIRNQATAMLDIIAKRRAELE